MRLPEYTLRCLSDQHARNLLATLQHRGYIHARLEGPDLIISWGGLFPYLADVGEVAVLGGAASDEAVCDFCLQWNRRDEPKGNPDDA